MSFKIKKIIEKESRLKDTVEWSDSQTFYGASCPGGGCGGGGCGGGGSSGSANYK